MTETKPWMRWFDADGNYLGERSARTGPDPVKSAQACKCDQCSTPPQVTHAPAAPLDLGVKYALAGGCIR